MYSTCVLTDEARIDAPCFGGTVFIAGPVPVNAVGTGDPEADTLPQFYLGSPVFVSEPTEGVVWCGPALPGDSGLLSHAGVLGPYSPVADPTDVVPVVYKVQDLFGGVKTGGVVEDAEEGVRMKSIVKDFGLGSGRSVNCGF